MEKKSKKINSRNYLIVTVVSVLLVIILLYARSFIFTYRTTKNNTSVFTDNIQSININDLDYLIPEQNESVIYVSYIGNSKIKSMENKLYKLIEKKNLKDKVIYLNVSDYLENNEYIEILREKIPEFANEINSCPIFIYVKEGKVIDIRSSELKMVDSKMFSNMIEEYEIQ